MVTQVFTKITFKLRSNLIKPQLDYTCTCNLLVNKIYHVYTEVVARICFMKNEISMKNRNFAKFTVKHLCQSISFNKVSCLSLQLY